LNSSTVFEELSNFRKLFLFSSPRKSSHLATTNPTQRSLELYTGFYAAGNSKPISFLATLQIRNPRRIAPNTTNPALQQPTPMGMRL
jgi:hypothetical protein